MKAVKGKYYFGGIRIKDMKDISKQSALEVLPEPETVAISCSQSIGKPSTPCVEAGQAVKQGQIIAKAEGAVSSNVFASIAGTVTEIKDLKGADGADGKYIFIKRGEKAEKEFLKPLASPTAEEIKERIKEAGIVGLGGAGFPTAVKLNPSTQIDTLIVNGAECEPYLTCDYRLMLEKTEEIVRGARYVAKALGAEKIVIAIEANKPDCIKLFEAYEDIQPVILAKKYPMGGEKQLIYTATGRKVGIGKLPADVGVIVQNVATCYAVSEAVELGKPLFERVVTVSGKGVKEPKNLWVKLGTPVKEIVDFCGGEITLIEKNAEGEVAEVTVQPKKVVQGGPMTGTALASYDVYTHKTTSGILLLTEGEAAAEEPTPCLNCGMCADVCPMHLMPMNTAFYSAGGDFEAAAKYGNVSYCIECGACEYICPAKRPLIQAIRKTKAALRNKEANK
ncbi:MAG: electron transport complex subunit RsxC [Clostridia bacterium]|nr:electron transport complex subunit RsxC [Clostridia bacterium]